MGGVSHIVSTMNPVMQCVLVPSALIISPSCNHLHDVIVLMENYTSAG